MSSTPVPLPERLTIEVASAALAGLTQAVGRPQGPVRLDASRMQDFDSSAVAVLLELRRQLLARGQSMAVDRWPAKLTALVRLYGVDSLLETAETAPSGPAAHT